MFLQETTSSMRAYLILSGLLGTLSYLGQLTQATGALSGALMVCGLALSLAYLYAGAKFKALIVTAPSRLLLILRLGATYLILVVAYTSLFGAGLRSLPGVGGGLLITWYLYASTTRLAREASMVPAPDVGSATA